MTKRRPIGWALAIVVGATMPARASAQERIAVLIVPDAERDRALADNLTEVAIARLAEISRYELVGIAELRRRLELTGGAELPTGCLGEPSCLGRVGVMAGVHRLVSGTVRSEGARFLLALALNDIQTGKVERTFFRAASGDLDALIRGIQDGVNDLFQHRPAAAELRVDSVPDGATVVIDERIHGTTPVWVSPLEPGTHRLRVEMTGRFPWKQEVALASGQDLLVTVRREQLAPRHTWAAYAAYGTAAAALLSFAAAALFGSLARGDLSGGTRREVEQDLDARRGYATIANVALVGGAMLAGASAFTFVRFRRDIAGD
jgi:hypothetical protein